MQNKVLIIVLLLSLLLSGSMLTRGHMWGDDFASYIMQAESILEGKTQEFVQHNSFTIFESSNQIGPVAYPWGYPLILTPVVALQGNNPVALKLPGLFFYLAFLVCLYLLMATRLTPTESLLITALFAFNPLLLAFLDIINSDIPFLFFSTLALLGMVIRSKHPVYQSMALGFVIASAFFIRTPGLLLLFTFIGVELLQLWRHRLEREKSRADLRDLLVTVGTFGVLWLVYALAFPGGAESYFAQYRDFQIQTVLEYIPRYFMLFGRFFGEQPIWKIVHILLFPFFLIGIWRRRRDDLAFILFFILWMIVVLTWPSWQGSRFIYPLLPLFLYFTFRGMEVTLGRPPGQYTPAGRWLMYGPWSIIVLLFFVTSASAAYTNLKNARAINGPYDTYSRQVYTYIQDKTPPKSVIIFFKPRAMRLMTGHDAIVSLECERMLKGDYLVLSKKVGWNQQIPPEEIDTCHLPLQVVLTNTRFVVYKIQK